MSDHQLRLSHHAAYLAVRGFLASARFMPLSILRAIGRTIAVTAAGVGGRDMKRATAHLEIAFPDLSDRARTDLLKACASHLGQVLGEVAWLRRATPGQVDYLCDITGRHHLQEALDEGRGAVLITGHLGNWELMNARLTTAGLPMSIAVRSVYDPRLDRLMTDLRSRFGSEVVHRGSSAGRQLLKALTRNRVIGLLIDQDIPDLAGTFVPFFGRPAWSPIGAATMAIRMKRPIVPAFSHRQQNGRHLVEIHPPLPTPEDGTVEERVQQLTAAATAAIERQIRRFPEQWVWMHRRWRTQPEASQEISTGRGLESDTSAEG